MDALELAFCDAGLPSSGPLGQAALAVSAVYLVLNVASIAIYLAAASLAGPLLAQGLGGKGDARFGMAFCRSAGTGWVFGGALVAHAVSWSIFAAYAACAVHILRHGAIVLMEVLPNRAAAFAATLISVGLAGVWLTGLGPTPQVVLLSLLGT